ncbi:MAG: phosphoglycerate mutase (2,3-diphosphoglycerate-independent) [Candidatus Marinimicrobia bacterium]|nr:phosphoglycerate mutase (2,3-diphosphoglycerate-independent) [Candidatus Neomarinimicrobiota bacterium]|tara:strand:- start:1963 stop:3492 length:1530 start_codon:yes stop_codon:yes gene_type:complete
MVDLPKRCILIILDGLGLRDARENNAFKLARTPTFDRLLTEHPWTALSASQEAVGLPGGVIGNSEVGHMTIGAGRVLKQDLVRINKSIADDSLANNPEIKALFKYVSDKGSALHLLGLISDGGVHSHLNHIPPIIRYAKAGGVNRLYLHAITDGRDTSPHDSLKYVNTIQNAMSEIGLGEISTLIGRYFAMDRDRRWERTERAYRLFVGGEGEKCDSPLSAIEKSHERGVTDEFIDPIVNIGKTGQICPDDAVLCFNFRADRMRQICSALGTDAFSDFVTLNGPVRITTMTSYHDQFIFPVLFKGLDIDMKLGQVLEQAGVSQLRVAETEKYAHVTYFFNGGEEAPYDAEERLLIPSPRVATYDLQPEMSAYGIRDAVVKAIDEEKGDAIVMNVANTDMVGHTGNLDATIRAAEVADEVLGNVLEMASKKRIIAFVTADHGNCEMMIDESTGREHTAHTLNQVPFVVVNGPRGYCLRSNGGLADVAPTILEGIGLPIPDQMSGRSLFKS